MCKTSSSWQWRKHLSLEVTFPFWLYSHWASLIAQLVKNPWAFLLSPVYLIFFILRISMDSFSWFPDISNEFQTVANILCSGLVKITYYHLYLLKLTKNIHCFFTCRLFFFFLSNHSETCDDLFYIGWMKLFKESRDQSILQSDQTEEIKFLANKVKG